MVVCWQGVARVVVSAVVVGAAGAVVVGQQRVWKSRCGERAVFVREHWRRESNGGERAVGVGQQRVWKSRCGERAVGVREQW